MGYRNSIEIIYFNRYTKQKEIEKVYGAKSVTFLYTTKLGQILERIFATKLVSMIYGLLQSRPSSARKVNHFVKNYNINMDDYQAGSILHVNINFSFSSFNEFFIRKFKLGRRDFPEDKNLMGAFSEARYYGHEAINDQVTIPVKGQMLSPLALIGKAEYAKFFEDGPLLLARLCPVDYHRYHYPDRGMTEDSYTINGHYHSVNPLAIKAVPEIFMKNQRRVSILETQNFGKLAFIEVGAVCVGKIVQTHKETTEFRRGQEKGYFLFGGSTVIVIGEKGKWTPSADILENTSKGLETYIRLGDTLASKIF